MVKCPPNRRARGPEAEPAGQPLVAKLKQDRLDSLAAVDARVVQVIADFTDRISEAIIAENKAMHTRHTEYLEVPVNAKFKGVDIDYHRFLTGVRQWAVKNGIKLTIGEQPNGIIGNKYTIGKALRLRRADSNWSVSKLTVKRFVIDFIWEDE